MQILSFPTTVLLLSFVLSTTASPIPIPSSSLSSTLVLDTRATPQFVPETQNENQIETREPSPRFKITTLGTKRPTAPAPKAGVVQSIKNGLKKLICNENNCVAEPAVDSDDEGSF